MRQYLTPFSRGNTSNLDSLRTPPTPVLGTGARWGSHLELTSYRPPRFDNTFVRLSDSGSVERWLAANGDGSELWLVPPESSELVSRVVAAGAIVLCTPVGNTWRVSIPRNDCFTTIVNDTDANQLASKGVRI
jgi:hypothetical protein